MQRQQSYSYTYKARSINWKVSPCLHMKMSWICREECYLVFSQGVLWISSDRDDRMGAKFKTPKNPYSLPQYPKKSHAEYLSCKNFQRNYANYAGYTGTIMNLHIVLNTLKNPCLIKLPKKILAKLSYPKKSPNWRFQTPKILQSSLSLEIQGSPLGVFRPGTKHLVCRLSEADTKNITTLSCILFLQNAQL